MKMLTRKLIILIALLSLAACQSRQVGQPGGATGSSTGDGSASGPRAQGTVDGGGGGNGIDNIPLEGFHVDMLAQDESKNLVMPIINGLALVDLTFAAEMYHVLEARSWMFVPVTMQQLSSARIGTYFPTDQFALQDTKEVWVDKNNFTRMTPDSRKELILHELIMGIRIMQFTDANDHCKIKADAEVLKPANPNDKNAPNEIRAACDHQHKPILGLGGGAETLEVGTKLSDDDYARIRTLTEKISENQGAFNADDVQDWVEMSGVDQNLGQ